MRPRWGVSNNKKRKCVPAGAYQIIKYLRIKNMKIKRNDKVKILAGKDKGKIGKVLQVFPDGNKASVEGINLLIKHLTERTL